MNIEKQYLKLLKDILDNGVKKEDRTGTGTISIFGRQIRHDMSKGFPLLTTKTMYWRGIVTELIWFLQGNTNIKYLVDNDCHIWDGDAYKKYEQSVKQSIDKATKEGILRESDDYNVLSKESFIDRIKTDNEFANKWGDLGPIYGKQWRRRGKWKHKPISWEYGAPTSYDREYEVDQIQQLIDDLRSNPDSRRLMVDAWNPRQLKDMTLPPCHYGFQVWTRELTIEERLELASKIYGNVFEPFDFHSVNHKEIDELYPVPRRAISLMWNQRSVDTPLGLPFNIASYALLLHIIARSVNMVPDELVGNLGDVHIYQDQVDGVIEQINREPLKLPKLEINSGNDNWHLLDIDEIIATLDLDITFKILEYECHPTIKFPLSN